MSHATSRTIKVSSAGLLTLLLISFVSIVANSAVYAAPTFQPSQATVIAANSTRTKAAGQPVYLSKANKQKNPTADNVIGYEIRSNSMTPRETVDYIATKRYGNPAWEKSIMGLSEKGLITEYMMMTASENYLNQQNLRLRNRIEMLLAGITQARLYEFNKKVKTLRIAAKTQALRANN